MYTSMWSYIDAVSARHNNFEMSLAESHYNHTSKIFNAKWNVDVRFSMRNGTSAVHRGAGVYIFVPGLNEPAKMDVRPGCEPRLAFQLIDLRSTLLR